MTELVRTYKLTDSGAWGWVTEEAEGGGGGGSLPETWNEYGSIATGSAEDSVPTGTDTPLSWSSDLGYFGPYGGGPEVFDLAIPTQPVCLASGNYTFSCETKVFGAHAGKFLSGTLFLDLDGVFDGPGIALEMAGAITKCQFGCRRYLPAGTKLNVIANQDSGGALDVGFWALVSFLAA